MLGGHHQGLCELEKDVLPARDNVRVWLVGAATPFDEPRGPCSEADVVRRLLRCCCRRRVVGIRFVGGIIVFVGVQARDDVRRQRR